jgi:hypothetical protein
VDPFKKKNKPGTKVSQQFWNEESLQNVTFATGENQLLNEHHEKAAVQLNTE